MYMSTRTVPTQPREPRLIGNQALTVPIHFTILTIVKRQHENTWHCQQAFRALELEQQRWVNMLNTERIPNAVLIIQKFTVRTAMTLLSITLSLSPTPYGAPWERSMYFLCA